MGERFTRVRDRSATDRTRYTALCGARLRFGEYVDIRLPDGLIIRRTKVERTLLGSLYVAVQLHGLYVRVFLHEEGLTLRRSSRQQQRKKAK